ncbi:MAG: phage holin family protein [Chloroflexi bacterium]|nr:phage holin family protein [Chloroflexota bacterium]MDA0244774.1 phage holin family protein [Chloroflexota bacterium]
MSQFLLRLFGNALALWAAIQIVPGITYDGTNFSLVIIALIFGVVNALVRPLIVLLTCPLIVLTLGLFLFVVNAIMLSITEAISDWFDLGLYIDGFWATLFGAIIISIVSGLFTMLVRDKREDSDYKARYNGR